jgi:hypothetical protein
MLRNQKYKRLQELTLLLKIKIDFSHFFIYRFEKMYQSATLIPPLKRGGRRILRVPQ